MIHFDLEDADRSAGGPAPEHGSVGSVGDLALVLRWWLAELAETA